MRTTRRTVGNPTSIQDAVNGETIAYLYDEMDRLRSATSTPAGLGETYTYQPIGNLATKNSLTYSYDATHKHAISAYNGTT